MSTQEKTAVRVIVRSEQRNKRDGERHRFHVEADGSVYRKGESLYLVYREDEETGLGSTLTTVRVEGNTCTLIRQGETVMKQVLVKGEEQHGTYKTPYGTFELVTRTSRLVTRLSEQGGRLEAEYNLRLGGEKSRMVLQVDVQPLG